MSDSFDKERLIALVGRLCDDQISEEEIAELETTLTAHKEARQLYHLTVAVDRDLQSCDIGEVTDLRAQPFAIAQERRWYPWTRLAIAASILVVLFLIGYQLIPGGNKQRPSVAAVTDLIDAKWASGQAEISLGERVPAGRLQMEAGTLCLTFNHGVVMTVEGPADFELLDTDHVALHQGQLVAYVPDGAEGFTVSTDTAKVVDLGTEFAVSTRDDGSSDVVVFDGEVELAARNQLDSSPRRVVAGLAYRVDRDGASHQEEFRQSEFENARSVIRRRKVIRESFRSDKLFPGEAKNGWTGSWSLVATSFVIDNLTGIQSELPLASGTRNYLTVAGANESDNETGSLILGRGFGSFDEFDVTQPYTLEFLFRLESDPSKIERIRVFGARVPLATVSDRGDWEVATPKRRDGEDLRWQLYRPHETRSNTLPLIQDQTYRFLIEVNPQKSRWRASISDGKQSIWNTLKDGGPLRLSRDPDPNAIGWELVVAPDAELRFSLDAIRIQNNPAATLEPGP